MNTLLFCIFLIVLLCQEHEGFASGSIADMGHYSQTLIESIIDIYSSNNNSSGHSHSAEAPYSKTTTNQTGSTLIPVYIYPYILLALWIICICKYYFKLFKPFPLKPLLHPFFRCAAAIICCCLYCKCQQAEAMTSYNTNTLELQEVHILDHPLPHVKGCVCLCCLQRQIKQEVIQK